MWVHIVLLVLVIGLAVAWKIGWLKIEGLDNEKGKRLFLLVAIGGNLLGLGLTLTSGEFKKDRTLVSRVLGSFKLSSPLLAGLSELLVPFGVFFIVGWIIGYGIYALMCVSKYRSTMARHNFESETRAKICNLKSDDELMNNFEVVS